MPNAAAAEAYDAMHVVAAALRHAGANRARVRDVLAAGTSFQGATGAIFFDSAGNERGDIVVVRLQGASFAGTSF
jgi:ABC-type branched-subunit amino acid transport system substrate-binding protein